MRTLTPVAAIVALLAAVAPAAAGIDVGPAVGAAAPALSVVDASGSAQSLRGLQAKKGTVLVFFRSAQWCPYCQRQLIALNAATAPLAARGYRLAAISYDTPATLTKFAARQGIDFPLLSDTGSATIDAFRLRDPQYPAGNIAYGVPVPAIFVIDTGGVVRGKLAEAAYRDRPPVAAVLAMVDGLE